MDELNQLLEGVADVNGWLLKFGEVAGIEGRGTLSRLGWVEEYTDDVNEGYHYKQVHSEGGHEGGGEHVERIYEIYKDDQTTGIFFELAGFYSSYEGIEWDDCVTRVYPHQVMVTQYRDYPEA
jgi:hypothetical protein